MLLFFFIIRLHLHLRLRFLPLRDIIRVLSSMSLCLSPFWLTSLNDFTDKYDMRNPFQMTESMDNWRLFLWAESESESESEWSPKGKGLVMEKRIKKIFAINFFKYIGTYDYMHILHLHWLCMKSRYEKCNGYYRFSRILV